MRKQTKLVAVLSAAALLAMGASMTSFAAGWERDEAGIWHYYDRDDEMVTGEWQKDNGKWFYLDDEGDMLTDAWIDEEYYVGSDGAMLINGWIKGSPDEDFSDPDDDTEGWYYFGSKGKKTTESKKINGRTYYFNDDGKMYDGWYQDSSNDEVYYLGGEDEGWRAEGSWLWLEKPDDEDDDVTIHAEDDECDDEAWYYFGSNGKMYKDAKRKKINGRYYYFNEHGQMLYEWINNGKVRRGSNAQLDGELANEASKSYIDGMLYMNQVEEGWRADGWYEIDGAQDVGTDNDTDWYYFDKGEPERAADKDFAVNDEDNTPIFRAKIKIKASNNKYFCFDEVGRMKTGLQYIPAQDGFYYFDENGYLKAGKLSNIEDDDDSFTFYFNTKNGRNGEGTTGVKDKYLYFGGKRLEADDDYKLYFVEDKVYLVNNKGKIQSSKTKKYDIEGLGEELKLTFSGDAVNVNKIMDKNGEAADFTNAQIADAIAVPSINLYDNFYGYDANGGRGWLPNGLEDLKDSVLGFTAEVTE